MKKGSALKRDRVSAQRSGTETSPQTYVNPARTDRIEAGPAARARLDRVLELLDEWMKDESGYDEATWPGLKKALDEDRPSHRKLFDD